jgi:transcriptional regulator with XRE-family HTH domain
MFSHTDSLCEVWNQEVAPPFPHSTLFHMNPIGVGTPMIESLTSYMMRLADAQSIQPNVLIGKAIVPLLSCSSQGRQPYAHRTAFWVGSPVLNGMTSLTDRFVQALSALTQQHDLRFLTMLPWKEVLSHLQSVRRTRAWCATCLEEWRVKGQTVYEPLLWALEGMHQCGVHGCLLQIICPHCASTLRTLAPRIQPGYCGRCDRWLGGPLPGKTPPAQVSEEEELWNRWVAMAVGELLAAAPNLLSTPCRDTIAASMKAVVNGNQLALARHLQMTQATIWQWLEGVRIPQLRMLLRMCYCLHISPLAFLTGKAEAICVTPGAPLHSTIPSSKRSQRRPYTRFDVERMRSALEAVVSSTEEPPPPMSEVARSLSSDQSILRRYFPELCRAISKRYLDDKTKKRGERIQSLHEEVRQAALTLLAQGCYPGNRQVAKLLRKPTSFMEFEVRMAWHQVVQELGVKPPG